MVKIKEKLEDKNKQYFLEIVRQKDEKTREGADNNYSVSLVYENTYEQERLSIEYNLAAKSYENRRQKALNDFTTEFREST